MHATAALLCARSLACYTARCVSLHAAGSIWIDVAQLESAVITDEERVTNAQRLFFEHSSRAFGDDDPHTQTPSANHHPPGGGGPENQAGRRAGRRGSTMGRRGSTFLLRRRSVVLDEGAASAPGTGIFSAIFKALPLGGAVGSAKHEGGDGGASPGGASFKARASKRASTRFPGLRRGSTHSRRNSWDKQRAAEAQASEAAAAQADMSERMSAAQLRQARVAHLAQEQERRAAAELRVQTMWRLMMGVDVPGLEAEVCSTPASHIALRLRPEASPPTPYLEAADPIFGSLASPAHLSLSLRHARRAEQAWSASRG